MRGEGREAGAPLSRPQLQKETQLTPSTRPTSRGSTALRTARRGRKGEACTPTPSGPQSCSAPQDVNVCTPSPSSRHTPCPRRGRSSEPGVRGWRGCQSLRRSRRAGPGCRDAVVPLCGWIEDTQLPGPHPVEAKNACRLLRQRRVGPSEWVQEEREADLDPVEQGGDRFISQPRGPAQLRTLNRGSAEEASNGQTHSRPATSLVQSVTWGWGSYFSRSPHMEVRVTPGPLGLVSRRRCSRALKLCLRVEEGKIGAGHVRVDFVCQLGLDGMPRLPIKHPFWAWL